jgi:hypothetical protein
MNNLSESLKAQLTLGLVQQLAVGLKESHTPVNRAMNCLLDTLLAGMVQRGTDRAAMANAQALLQEAASDPAMDNLVALAQSGKLRVDGVALKFVDLLFLDNRKEILEAVRQYADLKPSSAEPLLGAAVRLTMRFLGGIGKDNKGFTDLIGRLAKERYWIMAALPYEVEQLVDAEPVMA